MNPIIKLSDNAASRIKEIMSNAETDSLGVRVSVKTGGCAGMSYVMEYTKEINPSDLKDGNVARIICTNWSKKMENKNYNDSLAVYLYNSEFSSWLDNEAY